ncbi:hypothetical protein V6N12_037144 [Hibiscus sabdariffa]|uniref:Uncharacterized protein n=1 Tax=Hibiscus sabdariffa TaxID=183260 RepID=A0ABR1ZWC0_9ROSI
MKFGPQFSIPFSFRPKDPLASVLVLNPTVLLFQLRRFCCPFSFSFSSSVQLIHGNCCNGKEKARGECFYCKS